MPQHQRHWIGHTGNFGAQSVSTAFEMEIDQRPPRGQTLSRSSLSKFGISKVFRAEIENPYVSLDFHQDGNVAVCAKKTGEIGLINCATGAIQKTLYAKKYGVRQIMRLAMAPGANSGTACTCVWFLPAGYPCGGTTGHIGPGRGTSTTSIICNGRILLSGATQKARPGCNE